MFERIAAALFGSGRQAVDQAADRALIDELIEGVVDAVEPKVRMESRYRKKLSPCIARSIAYLRSIGREGLEPVLLTRAAWNDDPRVNAFFATAGDVPQFLGRSKELRAFFENPANAGRQEAFALMAMKKEERQVFGAELQGDAVRHDVAQTTVSFSGHRLLDPTATLAAARLEIGKRILLRLAQVALSRIIEIDMKATELQQHKTYLGARLRVLTLARDGMEGIVQDPGTIASEMKAVEEDLKGTVDQYIDTKGSIATLDDYLKRIDEVFSQPGQHLLLSHTPLKLTRMGVKTDDASGAVNALDLVELAIGEKLNVVIAIVRCPRNELPPKEDLIAQAERYL